ncbi:uncharacterized protein LOC122003945 [Zingiber officinale]|uniref:uncharacterized protein LOC122003945 n=1 Tax=Zingiber officinale TaxID=94328 RepID=UPI001C4BC0DF|nr:uncharacterized protein LOC122003945 [Zingiber officinale]
MAGASSLLSATRALQYSDHLTSCSSSSSSAAAALSSSCPLQFPWSGGAKPCRVQLRKRMAVSLATTVGLPDTKQKPLLREGVVKVAGTLLRLLNPPKLNPKQWRTRAEMLVEKGVTGCRSFTLIAVAGSIIGSILCFVEGCFFVLEAFYQYFQTVSSSTNQGRITQSLVESIDMFLVGTALLSFGISLYVMFVSSDDMKQKKRRQIAESTFGPFNLKKLAKSMGMQSISDAKSRLGHSILLILQAGMVEKLKEVELVSGMDLACFAGAVFVSSACVFVLSKLSIPRGTNAFST